MEDLTAKTRRHSLIVAALLLAGCAGTASTVADGAPTADAAIADAVTVPGDAAMADATDAAPDGGTTSPAEYASSGVFQIWREWEAGYEGPTTDSGRNIAWTQSPAIRSYGEIYLATRDTRWLDKMALWLDDVESRRNDETCNGILRKGWKDTGDNVYYPVHQGRVLTAFLEFARIVGDNPALQPIYQAAADRYLALAEEVVASYDDLYRTTSAGGTTVGYYRYGESPCDQSASWQVGPHNQSLAMGMALVLLHGLTGSAQYKTMAAELAAGLEHDLTHVSGHYEWPYWPSFSEAFVGGNTKAEDNGHAGIDVEFAVLAHEHGIGGFNTTDMDRLAKTMTAELDSSTAFGTRLFALRVDGTPVGSNPDNVSKVDDMRAGWIMLQSFAPRILDIAQAWCTNNSSHANAVLLRRGGPEMKCLGWCPAADRVARFDDGDAGDWITHAGCSGYVNPVSPQFGDNEKLLSRRGNGLMISREQAGGGDQNCDPPLVDGMEMNRYYDLDRSQAQLGPRLRIAGFTRSLSDYSGSSKVTNRCVRLLDAASGSQLASQCEDFANTTDSGWVAFDVDLTDKAAGVNNVRIVVGMYDSWATDWVQEIRIDELRICTQEHCGDGVCMGGEDKTSCPADCES
jgi:hypothetical protein